MMRNLLDATRAPIKVIGWPKQSIYGTLGLNKDSLVDLAILLGCDYAHFTGSPFFKPEAAYRLIQLHGTIENISNTLQHDKRVNSLKNTFALRNGYMEQVKIARHMFTLPPLPPPSTFQAIEPLPDLTSQILRDIERQLDLWLTPTHDSRVESIAKLT